MRVGVNAPNVRPVRLLHPSEVTMHGFSWSNEWQHVAIVPTIPGRESLLRRALDSVTRQTRPAKRVIVVPDGDDAFANEITSFVAANWPSFEVVHCRRTPGLSGAINTAIDHLQRVESGVHDVLVSLLDDDDHWNERYLEEIHQQAMNFDGFLVGTLVRHDEQSPHGRVKFPPAHCNVDDFLIGNPGVQGSNLTTSLENLLLVGGFDEALSSCTDRDLVIRLLDLGKPYRGVRAAIVHHDACHALPRLSHAADPRKFQGLDTFFAKYQWRMSTAVREASLKRSREYFGWSEPNESNATVQALQKAETASPPSPPLFLVIGMIVDGHVPARAKPLLEGLARLEKNAGVARLDVVLLENGNSEGYRDVLTYASAQCAHVWSAPMDAQYVAVEQSGLLAEDVSAKKSIAVARTLLHHFVHEVARKNSSSIAWILDDDNRLPEDVSALVQAISQAKQGAFDVVIGSVFGAPPIPAATTSRTQLVDLASYLLGAATHVPADPVQNADIVNARWKANRRDYYYDLARSETDRLETPFAPPLQSQTIEEGFCELARRVPKIFAGEAVTRPVDAPTGDLVANARPSRLRGGNTLVFRTDLLRDVPNLSPRWNGRPVRRSDMIWATNAAFRLSCRVVGAPFALKQDRRTDVPTNKTIQSLLEDIFGYAFFRAYDKTFEERGTPSHKPLTEEERVKIQRRFHKFANERFMAFRLAFWRARGLTMVLRRCVYGDSALQPWWLGNPRLSESLAAWRQFVHALEDRLSFEHLAEFESAFLDGLQHVAMDAFVQEQNAWFTKEPLAQPSEALTSWYDSERIRRARGLVRKYLRRDPEHVLGMGAEGVVMRTGDTVCKVFDGWTDNDRTQSFPLLQQLVAMPRLAAMPRITNLHNWKESVAIEMEFETSAPYTGGQGPALFGCLKSLVQAGLVHTNVQPDNLRVTATGVQIVDIGRSLQTYTKSLEEAMVRRAFLSWRFAFREDLKTLLRRTNTETDFAELVGWRGLLRGLRDEHPKQRLDRRIEECLRPIGAKRLLDYGAGKPRPLHQNAETDRYVVAFDPDDNLRERWEQLAPRVIFHSNVESVLKMEHGFDAVVCALVLCVVNDEEAKRVLTNLHRLVAREGRVFVAVCDPTSVRVHQTTQQIRCGTTNHPYRLFAGYEKTVGSSMRHEVHRPLDAYRRLFARAGLQIESEEVISGIDVDRFEEVGEFVLFELSLLAPLSLRTSLVIKACAMEAETIGHQVRHLVKMLESPRGFDEVVVVVDPFAGPFPRQYQRGDLPALLENLDGLVQENVIDRIVNGPSDGDECRAISANWFGVETTRAHAHNGQATLALLRAFELCSGGIILHVDADVLVGRPDPRWDHVQEAVRLYETIPTMVTLALPVFGDENPEPRFGDARGPYRVETQIGWVHRDRLETLRPLPNGVVDEKLELPWHRSVDRIVQSGKTASVRRGSSGLWYTSPENTRKVDLDELFLILDRVEGGIAPSMQRGHASTQRGLSEWLEPKRAEDLVVVACGRNVGSGRVARFRDALLGQTYLSWGLVIIDDDSDDGGEAYLPRLCAAFGKRMTLVRRRQRMGALANLVLAAKHFIVRPETIVVLVDLDDALATAESLAEVAQAYELGADVTVGTMVRTDKHIELPVDFDEPRKKRGGNVWQHLRTFRRYLFDQVNLADLQIDGKWVDLASDWAFMLPIIEMANKPVWLRKPNYLHEPGDARNAEYRAAREDVIATLVKRPAYSRKG